MTRTRIDSCLWILVALGCYSCARVQPTAACDKDSDASACAFALGATPGTRTPSDAGDEAATVDSAQPHAAHAGAHPPSLPKAAAATGTVPADASVESADAEPSDAASVSAPDRCAGVLTFADSVFELAVRSDGTVPDSGPLHAVDVASLHVLMAGGLSLHSIDGIECLKQLTVANLYENQIVDLSPLAGLKQLISVSAANNQIQKLSPLAGLHSLTFLDLSYNKVSDVSALAGLTSLQHLDLTKNAVADISALHTLAALQYLDVTSNLLSSVAVVAQLHELRSLSFGSNDIATLSAVVGLTNLTLLDASFNVISDLTPLKGLRELSELYLSKNAIVDLSAIAGLTQLTRLGLSRNVVIDLSPVKNLTALVALVLDSNQISDVGAVSGLTQLRRLWLQHNTVSSLDALLSNAGIGTGDEIVLSGDPVADCTQVHTLVGRGANVTSDCPQA